MLNDSLLNTLFRIMEKNKSTKPKVKLNASCKARFPYAGDTAADNCRWYPYTAYEKSSYRHCKTVRKDIWWEPVLVYENSLYFFPVSALSEPKISVFLLFFVFPRRNSLVIGIKGGLSSPVGSVRFSVSSGGRSRRLFHRYMRTKLDKTVSFKLGVQYL